jgi:hypothetical protein
MSKDRLFVEKRPQGDFAVRRPNSERASDVGVTTRSVQNCTLSRQGWERSPNIA